MRVLIVHNRYQQRGGEDTVVAAESELLVRGGHVVRVFEVSNESIKGVLGKAATLAGTPYNRDSYKYIRKELTEFLPEIVHIHNFVPLLSPSIHAAISAAGVPVVQTLHNFRTICAGAMLLRKERICEKCVEGSRLWGVVHRCYKDSFAGSAALVAMQYRASVSGVWHKHVDRFISLSKFSRELFIKGGLPEERIVVKPNFTASHGVSGEPRFGALFVGRLSEEKGIALLIQAWQSIRDITLTVVGDGPQREMLEAIAPKNVVFVGAVRSDEVVEYMRRAQLLVFPSIWFEGMPMTILEAFSTGLPVLASNLGALPEIITHRSDGLLFAAGDVVALQRAILDAFADSDSLRTLGAGAYDTHARRFSAQANLAAMEQIYLDAIKQRAAGLI